MTESDDLDLAVRIVPKGENGTVRLAVDFDGAQPPNQFFADLDMIGWQVSAMPPPPREAIDWSRPNPETGQRFSLSSWPVVGFVVEPPRGSARGGAWSNDETRPFMAALNGVLRRHGLGGAPPAARVDLPPTPPATETARRSTPAIPILASIGIPEGLDPVRLVADLPDADLFDRVELALSTIGLTARSATVDRTVTESYRASTYDRHEQVCVVDLAMPRSSVVAVIAILREFNSVPSYDTARFIEFDRVTAEPQAAPTPILSAVHTPEEEAGSVAIITLLLDPPRRILVEDELDGLPIKDIVWSKADRTVEETFRGSAYERTVSALRLQVWVTPDDARTVAPVLAGAAGVLMDDRDRFAIEVPPAGAPITPVDPNASLGSDDAEATAGGVRTA